MPTPLAQPTIVSRATAQTSIDVSASDVQARLDALWKQFHAGENIIWQPAYSPPFAMEWPPSTTTDWARYAFAYGRDTTQPGLADAQQVSRPWARIEYRQNGTAARIILLGNRIDNLGIQGVRPLRSDEATLLAKASSLWEYALQLNALPAKDDPQANELKAYYRLWVSVNGVLMRELQESHQAFLAWVAQS